MRYLVDVEGAEVGVERPWSRRPRLLVDGTDLPTDRWGRRLLTTADGSRQEVRVGYRALFLGPHLDVAGRHYPIGRPVPTWALVVLAAFVAVGTTGGASGALLSAGAAIGSVRLLIDPRRSGRHVAAAVALPVLALIAHLLVAGLLAAVL